MEQKDMQAWDFLNKVRGYLDEYELFKYLISKVFINKVKQNQDDCAKYEKLLNIAMKNIESVAQYKSDVDKKIDDMLMSIENENIIYIIEKLLENSCSVRMAGVCSSKSITKLVYKLLDIKNHDIVCDMCSGYGNALLDFHNYAADENLNGVKFLGGDINTESVNISKMLMYSFDIEADINNIDYIRQDIGYEFNKSYIFPPFSLRIPDSNSLLYNKLFNARTSSEWIFIDKMLSLLPEDGKIVALVSERVLFNDPDKEYREYLARNGYIEGIISLPTNCITGTAIKTNIIVLSKNNKNVKLYDAKNDAINLVRAGRSDLNVSKIYEGYIQAQTISSKDLYKEKNFTVASLLCEKLDIKNAVKLFEIADVFTGTQYTAKEFEKYRIEGEYNYRILTSKDINDGIVDWDNLTKINYNDYKFEKYVVKQGDIIVTSKSSKVKFAVVDEDLKDNVIVTGGMIIVRPKTDKIDPTFLKLYFESKYGEQEIKRIQKGSVIISLNSKDLKNIFVSCPDLEYQKIKAKKFKQKFSSYVAMKREVELLEDKLSHFYDVECEN